MLAQINSSILRQTLSLLGKGNPGKIPQVSPQKLINLYPSNDKTLYRTWGTDLFTTLTNMGNIRGVLTYQDSAYVVSDSSVYIVGESGFTIKIGDLNTTVGNVVIITNNYDQIMFVDGFNGYTYTISTSTFATISDVDFFPPEFVTFKDGRGIYAKPGTAEFYLSDLLDFTSYESTKFATAESLTTDLVSVFATDNDLFLFGQRETEIWASNGDSSFPFEKRLGVSLKFGLAAIHSVVNINNNIIFLAKSPVGKYQLMTLEGYQPKVVGEDEDDAYVISSLDTVDDAIAFSFEINSRLWYAITFPTEDKSFLYDIKNNKLIQWSSWEQDGSTPSGDPIYIIGRHLAQYAFTLGNKVIVGDYRGGGRLLELSDDIRTDYQCGPDNSIYYEVTSPVILLDNRRIECDRVALDITTGYSSVSEEDINQDDTLNSPLLTVALSKDAGATFGYKRMVNFGYSGEYNKQVTIPHWGSFIRGAFKIYGNHPSMIGLMNIILYLKLND